MENNQEKPEKIPTPPEIAGEKDMVYKPLFSIAIVLIMILIVGVEMFHQKRRNQQLQTRISGIYDSIKKADAINKAKADSLIAAISENKKQRVIIKTKIITIKDNDEKIHSAIDNSANNSYADSLFTIGINSYNDPAVRKRYSISRFNRK